MFLSLALMTQLNIKGNMKMRKLLLSLLLLLPCTALADIPVSDLVTCNGATSQVKFAVIDETDAGDKEIVAAVAGKKIRVLSYVIIASATSTVRWESGPGGTALTGSMSLSTIKSTESSCSVIGCFQAVAGESLSLETTGAVSFDGHLTYIECS